MEHDPLVSRGSVISFEKDKVSWFWWEINASYPTRPTSQAAWCLLPTLSLRWCASTACFRLQAQCHDGIDGDCDGDCTFLWQGRFSRNWCILAAWFVTLTLNRAYTLRALSWSECLIGDYWRTGPQQRSICGSLRSEVSFTAFITDSFIVISTRKEELSGRNRNRTTSSLSGRNTQLTTLRI